MARITDTLLVQRVDDQIVVLVDETGALTEVTFPIEVIPNVIASLGYLYDPEDPERAIREWQQTAAKGT